MSHTKGKLAVNGDRIESEKDHGWVNDGWIVAKCEGPDAFNNARRLAACWNALDSIPTEWLEKYVDGGVGLKNIVESHMELVMKEERLAEELIATQEENAALKTEVERLRSRVSTYRNLAECWKDRFDHKSDVGKPMDREIRDAIDASIKEEK